MTRLTHSDKRLLLRALSDAAEGLSACLNGFEPCFTASDRALARRMRRRNAAYQRLSGKLKSGWRLEPAAHDFIDQAAALCDT